MANKPIELQPAGSPVAGIAWAGGDAMPYPTVALLDPDPIQPCSPIDSVPIVNDEPALDCISPQQSGAGSSFLPASPNAVAVPDRREMAGPRRRLNRVRVREASHRGPWAFGGGNANIALFLDAAFRESTEPTTESSLRMRSGGIGLAIGRPAEDFRRHQSFQ